MDDLIAQTRDTKTPLASGDERPAAEENSAGAKALQPQSEQPGKDRPAISDKDRPATNDNGKRQPSFLRRHPILIALVIVIFIAAAIVGVLWWLQARHYETTDDAFVAARQFAIGPKVSGYLVNVNVTDNQYVSVGTTIAEIDPRDYQIALHEAMAKQQAAAGQLPSYDAQIAAQKAQIDEAQQQADQSHAALILAQQQDQRAANLVQTGAGTLATQQQAHSQLLQAQADYNRTQAAVISAQKQISILQAQRGIAVANLDEANAERDQAQLNLNYTTMKAEQAGRIVQLTGAKGQYVVPGQMISMFVPDPLWVIANFEETQIDDMRPGQPVTMTIDAYPGRTFQGHIDSIQPGSGTAFALLPTENATGNYVKVVQRVPVKIDFDHLPSDITLGPGMSVVPSVRVR